MPAETGFPPPPVAECPASARPKPSAADGLTQEKTDDCPNSRPTLPIAGRCCCRRCHPRGVSLGREGQLLHHAAEAADRSAPASGAGTADCGRSGDVLSLIHI